MIIDIIIYSLILFLGFIVGCSFITMMYIKMGALDWQYVKSRQWNAVENPKQMKKKGDDLPETGHARMRKY